jgi:CRP-like cAMP-binding protein
MNLPQLGCLEDHDVEALLKGAEDLEPENGTVIQSRGDPIKGLYFIVEGGITE